jgi:hypothetical protein
VVVALVAVFLIDVVVHLGNSAAKVIGIASRSTGVVVQIALQVDCSGVTDRVKVLGNAVCSTGVVVCNALLVCSGLMDCDVVQEGLVLIGIAVLLYIWPLLFFLLLFFSCSFSRLSLYTGVGCVVGLGIAGTKETTLDGSKWCQKKPVLN